MVDLPLILQSMLTLVRACIIQLSVQEGKAVETQTSAGVRVTFFSSSRSETMLSLQLRLQLFRKGPEGDAGLTVAFSPEGLEHGCHEPLGHLLLLGSRA